MEAIWKSFKYLALKLEMLGRHKRQRRNSRSECQKTNCDLLYFSYLLLFFVSCLCVCVPYFSFCLLCVYFSSVINQQAEQAENANCAHFPFPFYLSLCLCHPSLSIDYRLGHLLMKSMWQSWSKKKEKNHSKCVCKFAEPIY